MYPGNPVYRIALKEEIYREFGKVSNAFQRLNADLKECEASEVVFAKIFSDEMKLCADQQAIAANVVETLKYEYASIQAALAIPEAQENLDAITASCDSLLTLK